MDEMGIKRINAENWLQPDPIMSAFAEFTSQGKIAPKTGQRWLEDILRPKLDDNVPLEVRKLYEVARGAMAYGYYFYPIFSLCWEQLFRVGDAAVAHKCRQMGHPDPTVAFYIRLHFLRDNGTLSPLDYEKWNNIRLLRNEVSHADNQNIVLPGNALETLEMVVQSVNALFH